MNYHDADLNSDEYTIDISNIVRNLLRGFRKLFWLIPLLGFIAALILCLYTREKYSARYTAAVTFTVNLNLASNGSIYEDSIRASQLSATFPYIITSSVLKNIIAEDLGIEGISEQITAENVEDTNLFTIKVTSVSPQKAYDVLQSVIKNYPVIAETVVGGTHLDMIEESGVPKEPSNSIDYFKQIIYGAAAGAAIGLIIMIGYALARKTIHKPEDLTDITSIKFLGILSHFPNKRSGKATKSLRERAQQNDKFAAAYIDDMYKIRTRAEKIINNKDIKTILITSAIPGEGKSTFAYNLALAMAEQDNKTLLVDCDFRRPNIKNMLPESEVNIYLNDVLEGKERLDDAIKYYEETRMSVLACSKPLPNASEIIGAQRMNDILEVLKETYDYIILDSAPSAILSDTLDLAKSADGVLYVIRQDYSQVRHIQEGLEHIMESSKAYIIGCVLNNVKNTHMGYGYGHYGSYVKSKNKNESNELITNHME